MKGKMKKVASAQLPTTYGLFTITVYADPKGCEHAVLSVPNTTKSPTLVRVHSKCLTGDTFFSKRCDCNEQLHASMKMIQKNKQGIIVYLNQEGRGIGLGNKIKAYALQERGRDTLEANLELGFPGDARTYDTAACILKDMGAKKIVLLTNNPDKEKQLASYGITIVKTKPLQIPHNVINASYLATKKNKMGHRLRNL